MKKSGDSAAHGDREGWATGLADKIAALKAMAGAGPRK